MSDLLDDVVAAAGLTVFGAASVPGSIDARTRLDPAVLPLARSDDHDLVARIAALRAEFLSRGLDHVVLCGMGESSLAAEVIGRTLGVELTVLDSSDPHQVRAALDDRLGRSVVVVASRSGSTVETDSHRRAYQQAFEDAGLQDVGRRFVFVTEPGSPLATTAREMGAHLFLASSAHSAFSAFGLVPSGLAGVRVDTLLDEAFPRPAPHFAAGFSIAPPAPEPSATDFADPALMLGAALAAGALAGRDKLALASDGTGLDGLSDWIEHLVASSTAGSGRGLLPVVLENPSSWGHEGPDVLSVTTGGALAAGVMPGGGTAPDLAVNGPLGAQFVVWERAAAIAGRLLGADPSTRPDSEPTRLVLDAGLPHETPTFVDGVVEVYGNTSATTLVAAVDELARGVPPFGYLAATAYLDRVGDAAAAGVRDALAARVARAVTFGWGPRYLHSTGRLHKGGPATGSFLQITGAVTDDLQVPGRPYTFGELQAAQAAGDRQALLAGGRPVLRLHLIDRATGIEQLLAALGG
ncbi:glucose-6-phosphate isomerase [Dactylosporangium fulvum]|uniref:Glucose-6-phosphate isomerase n=1 Tax=Dactylosporangium fulvum TaxID=53359 RepID=A0ABY5W6Y2_9ACTN|nr:glucose-6-phosphate isomerase [Dactylosporangium fulvum]UWP84463.1 glucose-6-phosphate isomerase [Dactylosporangium fulvum]